MTSKEKGDIGEIIIMAEFIKKGITVAKPFGDNARYDLIADFNGKLNKIQVKYCDQKIRNNSVICPCASSKNHTTNKKYTTYENDIDYMAFYLKEWDICVIISIDEIIPGETRRIAFTVSNYYIDDNGENVITETDMLYDLKVRTTTNLPLEYKMYKNQGLDVDNLTNILEIETVQNQNMYLDEDNTIFKNLVFATQSDDKKAEGITDSDEFYYTTPETNTYILEMTLPATYNSVEYQNVIECIEITVDSEQRIDVPNG